MSVGIIVDGSAEAVALVPIIEKLRMTGFSVMNPIYADMQPRSTPKQIVRSTVGKMKILESRNAEKVIVLIDLEERSRCAVNFHSEIEAAFNDMGWSHVLVVVKVVAFENWLISDPDGIKKLNSRFSITKDFIKSVSSNNSDNVDEPVKLLNKICVGKKSYHKRDDARAIANQLDPLRMAKNSRSFRRFLRVIGLPDYLNQSKVSV